MGMHTGKSKDYYFSLFKTTKARILAREIDEYLYNESSYKDEVEDYHEKNNNLLYNPQAVTVEDEEEVQNEIVEDLIDKAKVLIIDNVDK